jgi:hypothetical protein
VSSFQSSQPSLAPVLSVVTPPVSVVPTSSSNTLSQAAFIPTIASLRADPQLAVQAEQLAADVSSEVAGNSPMVYSMKRGIVRCGGDLAPKVKVPWPQDYVLGSGGS